MSNSPNGRPCASDAATSIVFLLALSKFSAGPTLSDFCEGNPAPLLPAGLAVAGTSPSFSVTSVFLCVLCVRSFDFRCRPHPTKPQFLFDTNEPSSFLANFPTHTKQSTSYFLFDTNERSRITAHQSLITTHELRKSAATLAPPTPCRLTPSPRLRTMRRMTQKQSPATRAEI